MSAEPVTNKSVELSVIRQVSLIVGFIFSIQSPIYRFAGTAAPKEKFSYDYISISKRASGMPLIRYAPSSLNPGHDLPGLCCLRY
jgi:hypothetical protein